MVAVDPERLVGAVEEGKAWWGERFIFLCVLFCFVDLVALTEFPVLTSGIFLTVFCCFVGSVGVIWPRYKLEHRKKSDRCQYACSAHANALGGGVSQRSWRRG